MLRPVTAIFLICLLGVVLLAVRQEANAEPRRAAPPTEFEKFHFVLLATGEEPPTDLSDAERQELQMQHLGHLTKMAEEGYTLVAGPFDERFDERWRGMVLYRGDLSREEVVALAEADPSVQAGLMKVEVMAWYTSKGAVKFPMAEAMRDDHAVE